MSIKDIDGSPILVYVVELLHSKDPEFINFKAQFQESYDSIKCVVDDIKKESAKAKVDLNTYTNLFELIKKTDPDVEDVKFGREIQKFLVDS